MSTTQQAKRSATRWFNTMYAATKNRGSVRPTSGWITWYKQSAHRNARALRAWKDESNTADVLRNPGVVGAMVLAGLATGAAAFYWFDPRLGRRRRALLQDQFVHTGHRAQHALRQIAVDLMQRAQGAVREARGKQWQQRESDPEVLTQRVRAMLGHVCMHPRSIVVTVHERTAHLTGSILRGEERRIVHAVKRVPGIERVVAQLHVPPHPEQVPEFQGIQSADGSIIHVHHAWSPTTRLCAGLAGAAAVQQGIRRGDVWGWAAMTLGAGLLARGIANRPFGQIFGFGPAQKPIHVMKAITIQAPIKEVFNFWQHVENFPRFMSHVKEVTPRPDGHFRWRIQGPGNTSMTWESAIVRIIPNQEIQWRSVGKTHVYQSGTVRFEKVDHDITRVHVHILYMPPAGMVGYSLAKLLGSDPKHFMDDDLLRMKSLLENGRSRVNGKIVHLDELDVSEIVRADGAAATGARVHPHDDHSAACG